MNRTQQWNTPLVKVVTLLGFIILSQMWASELAVYTGNSPDRPSIWLGFISMGIVLSLFAALFWWLILSPISTSVEQDRSPETRRMFRIVGLFAVLSGLSFATGAAADAIQHALSRSLVFEVEDFFTLPHYILYASFLINAVVGAVVLGRLIFGKGDVRVRARRVLPLTIFALASAYVIAAAPIDVLWHAIYGTDITAWSVPHVTLLFMTCVANITGTSLLLAGREPNRKNTGLQFGVLILMMCWTWSVVLMYTSQTEWFGDPVFRQLPGWVRPFIVYVFSMFAALMSVNLLGHRWMATVVALLMVGARLAVHR